MPKFKIYRRKKDKRNAVLAQYVTEIECVEKELDTQLRTLSEEVDKSFSELASVGKMALKTAYGSVMFSRNPTFGIIMAIIELSAMSIGGAYSGYKQAKHHNKVLDRILSQKGKIARAKIRGTEDVFAKCCHTSRCLKQLVINEMNNEFEIKFLRKVSKLKIENSIRLMNLYRTAVFQQLVLSYLLDEYAAWISGKHTSTTKRPTYLDANNTILATMLEGKNRKRSFYKMLKSQEQTISGRELYCLCDWQFTSLMILSSQFKERGFDIRELPLPKDKLRKRIMKKNVSYKLFRHARFKSRFYPPLAFAVSVFLNPFVIGIELFALGEWGIYSLFRNYINWSGWIELLVGIGLSLIVIVIVLVLILLWYSDVSESITQWAENTKERVYMQSLLKMKACAGWVKYNEPDWEKKGLVWSTVKGMFLTN